MKRKLITWEKFEKKFKPLADVWLWFEEWGYIWIEYNKMKWAIRSNKKRYFGEEIDVDKIYSPDYTHELSDSIPCFFHELWFEPKFEPIEFITEEEFSV